MLVQNKARYKKKSSTVQPFMKLTMTMDLERNNLDDMKPLISCSGGEVQKRVKNSKSRRKSTWKTWFLVGISSLSVAAVLFHCVCCRHVKTTLEIGSTDNRMSSSSVPPASSPSFGLEGGIPPIHPKHQGSVKYSSIQKADGSILYRRDINAPCDNGMLLFSVGPARKDLPYQYDVYDDAYLFSKNDGLCILYPSYTGYQTADFPFWRAMDPMTVVIKPCDVHKMHRISSRIVGPETNRTIDAGKVGDYIIIGKHNFYNPHYYQQLKATVNSWTDSIEEEGEEEEMLPVIA